MLNFLIISLLVLASTSCSDKPNPKHDVYQSKEFSLTCDMNTDKLKDILDEDVSAELECLKRNLVQYSKYVRRESNRGFITRSEIKKFIKRYFPPENASMADALDLIFNLNTLILKDEPGQISLTNIVPFFKILIIANIEATKITKFFKQIESSPENYMVIRDDVQSSVKKFAEMTLSLVVNSDKDYHGQVSIEQFLVALKEQMKLDLDIETISSFLFIKKLLVGGDKETVSPDEVQLFLSKLEEMAMAIFDVILATESAFSSQKQYFEFMANRFRQFQSSMYQWNDETPILTIKPIISILKMILGDKHDVEQLSSKLEILKKEIFGGQPDILNFSDVKASLEYAHESFTALASLERAATPYSNDDLINGDDLDLDSFIELIISKSDKVFATSLDMICELKAILIGGKTDQIYPRDVKSLIPILMSFRNNGVAATKLIKKFRNKELDFWKTKEYLEFHFENTAADYKKFATGPNINNTEVDILQFFLKLKEFLEEFNFGIKIGNFDEKLIPTIKALKMMLLGGKKDFLTTDDMKMFMEKSTKLGIFFFDFPAAKKEHFKSDDEYFNFTKQSIINLQSTLYTWDDNTNILDFDHFIDFLDKVLGEKYEIPTYSSKLQILKKRILGGDEDSFSYLEIKTVLDYMAEIFGGLTNTSSKQHFENERDEETTGLADFLKKFLSKDEKIIEQTMDLIWNLKLLTQGKTIDYFAPSDVTKILPFIVATTKHGTSSLQTIKKMKNASKEEMWHLRDTFINDVVSIAEAFKQCFNQNASTSIPLETIVEYSISLLKEFGVNVDDKFLDDDFYPAIVAVKLIFMGGKSDQLSSNDLSWFFSKFSDIAIAIFDIFYMQEKSYDRTTIRAEHLYNAIYSLKEALHKSNEPTLLISIPELETVIKTIYPKYQDKKIDPLIRTLKKIFLKNESGFISSGDLDTALSIALEGIELNYFNVVTYELVSISQQRLVTHPPLNNYNSRIHSKVPSYWKRFSSDMKVGKYYLDEDGSQYFNYDTKPTNYGLNFKILLRWGLEYLYKYFGSTGVPIPDCEITNYSITPEKLQEAFVVMRPLLDLLNFEISPTMAQTTSYLGDLFQFKSNGNSALDIYELRDYLEAIFSSFIIGDKFTSQLPEACRIIDKENDKTIYKSSCVKGLFYDIFLNKIGQKEKLIAFSKYIRTISDEEKSNFIQAIELFTKSDKDPLTPYTSFDITMLIGSIKNIESAFIRFDLNQDGIINKDEAELAYPTYKQLIIKMGDGAFDNDSKLAKSAFLYMLDKMKVPSFLTLIWYHGTSKKEVNATRLSIAKLMEIITSGGGKIDNDKDKDKDDDYDE